MKVREVAWEDFPAIVENYYSIYDELPANPGIGIFLFPKKPSMADEVRWFGNFYAGVLEGKQVASVVEVDGRVVGMCQVQPDGPPEELGHRGTLGILIRNGYRGKGLGRALILDVLAKCPGKFDIVGLGVLSHNEVAKKLYKGVGFVELGTVPKKVKRGGRYYDELLMDLDLSRWTPPASRGAP